MRSETINVTRRVAVQSTDVWQLSVLFRPTRARSQTLPNGFVSPRPDGQSLQRLPSEWSIVMMVSRDKFHRLTRGERRMLATLLCRFGAKSELRLW